MNVFYYIVSYVTSSWRRSVSMMIAYPIAKSVSPFLITYATGSSFLVVSPLVHTTAYLLAQPIGFMTYHSGKWLWNYSVPQIEMMTYKSSLIEKS